MMHVNPLKMIDDNDDYFNKVNNIKSKFER